MNRLTIGFLWYLMERTDIIMDLDNPKKFTEQCDKYLKRYLEKYPNGLTAGGGIIEF